MRKFGLIGYPLVHSFSATWFAELFRREAITDATYQNFPLADISELPALLKEIPELRGLNVTIPHKESVLSFLHEIDPTAREIGAVNCIRISDDGYCTGYNTDAYGFERSLGPFLENRYERALVLGTGGSSRAISWVLRKWGLQVIFVSRNPSAPDEISWNDISPSLLNHFHLIVNCTPLGTFPDISAAPAIPYHALSENHLLYDLVYNPPLTRFLELGKNRGCTIMNGQRMLELQAEKSWEIWNTRMP